MQPALRLSRWEALSTLGRGETITRRGGGTEKEGRGGTKEGHRGRKREEEERSCGCTGGEKKAGGSLAGRGESDREKVSGVHSADSKDPWLRSYDLYVCL